MSLNRQNLSLREIDAMRNNILTNLRMLESSKHLMRTHDRVKLVNHHNFILETLDNMINIKRVEMADPYNNWGTNMSETANLDPSRTERTVVYNRDGTTRMVEVAQLNTTGQEWETQFDQSQLLNPPCYSLPPQNVYGLNKINQIRQQNHGRN